MLEVLNTWDTNLFLFLNGFHNRFFDSFMFLFSDKWIWSPLYAAVLFLAIKTWKKTSVFIILALFLCILIADQVSSGFLKPLIERPRPSRDISLEGIVHLVNNYKGGRFGFVSSHAANAFGFALLSSLIFKNRLYTITFFLWAVLTAYSRIYLGVHYPLDILGGTIVGIFAATICWQLLKFTERKFVGFKLNVQTNTAIPLFTFGITVLAIVLYSLLIL